MQASAANDDAEKLLNEGVSALQAGDKARARELLGQAIRHNPRDERAWLWLSGAVETDAERQQCLERVLMLNPQHTAARNGLAVLAAAAANPPSAPAAPISPTARTTAAKPLIASPPPPPAETRPAVTLDALAGLRPTSASQRVNPRVVTVIALACVVVVIGAILVARRFGAASSAAQPATAAAVALAATDTPTRPPTARPRPTQTATATPTATPSATAAQTSTPSAADKLVLQGLAKAQRKDYQGAIVLYNQAIQRDPKNTAAYFQRGQARDGLGDPKSAIKNYDLVLQIDPKHGAAYSARGDARLKLKDKPGALDDYQHAVEIYTSAGDTERSDEITAKIKALQ